MASEWLDEARKHKGAFDGVGVVLEVLERRVTGLKDPEHPTLGVNTSNCADDHPPNGRVPHFTR
jgi:hypothetical protein